MKRISLHHVKTTSAKATKRTLLCLSTALLFACAPEPQLDNYTQPDTKLAANVIYGSDGRLDLYQVTDDRLKALADSTVALVKTSDLTVSGTTATLKGRNFGADMNLCAGEKYREQDTAAFCSGTLVGSDIVLTAGHCIETQSSCDQTAFVFGFAVKSAGILPKTVASSEVYRCKSIIKTHRVNSGADFAIIRLDRSVTNHTAVAVRPTGDVGMSDGLVVIGHPVGLPTKVATGGTVRSIANSDYFQANLDTYGGNSGSGVFNASTGLIEGVLVRGEQDFESKGSCTVSKVCAEGACRGEDVTKISAIRPFLPAVVVPSPTPTPVPVPNPKPDPVAAEKFAKLVNAAIPDFKAAGISSSVAVTSKPNGRKVFIDVNISHNYIGDLVIKVTAADGKVVTLHQRAGGKTQNLIKSYEVTSQLGTVASAGMYKITVQDLAAVDKGTLVSWAVRFNP